MRTDVFWIASILLAASLAVSQLIPQMVGYVIVLGVYVLFVGTLIATDRFAVGYHWAVLLPMLLIWAVFVLTTALDPTRGGVLRLGAFTVITGVNLFVIPAVLDRTALHDAIAYIAGAFVLIGLPTVFIGAYGIAGFTITPHHTNFEFLGPGVVLNTPTSVFDNPNYLSSVAAIGAVAAGAKLGRSRALLATGLVGLNVIGVVLAGGRAGLLALVVAGVLYIIYHRLGRTAMATLVVLGALAVVVGFAMVFSIIPGPSTIANINLGDRRIIWRAVYEAVADRPVIGWGPGDDSELLAAYLRDSVDVTTTHNSYLRVFLISGILGGGAYLALSISEVIIGVRRADSEAVFTFLLLVAFLIIQLFEGMTIFGLSLLSILGALFVGYVQSLGASRRVEFSVRNSYSKYSRKTSEQQRPSK
jgi:O-antigen ligase